MTTQHSDKLFTGSIPEIYERYLVPLIFEYYAKDLATRVNEKPVSRVLEIAAGTGVVTRALANELAVEVSIVATDLNQDMLDYGASVRSDNNVSWQQADAMALPFEDDSFDAVICQFGVMFIPERTKAYSETLRVLKPGGRFIFNVWDKIEENEFADTVTNSLVKVFPDNPPHFLPRTPHGYHNIKQIASELENSGFRPNPVFETVTTRSTAFRPSVPAVAYCQGTPLRNEIENRDSSLLHRATEVATDALARSFGAGPIEGKIQGHVAIAAA